MGWMNEMFANMEKNRTDAATEGSAHRSEVTGQSIRLRRLAPQHHGAEHGRCRSVCLSLCHNGYRWALWPKIQAMPRRPLNRLMTRTTRATTSSK